MVSGLWTEVCNLSFAFSAMAEGGYDIFMVADASGGTTREAHDWAMARMVQAGVVPMTWQQVMLEWQRDWARRDTYDAVMAIVKEHSGAYGMGVDYAYTLVHGAPERVSHGPRLEPGPRGARARHRAHAARPGPRALARPQGRPRDERDARPRPARRPDRDHGPRAARGGGAGRRGRPGPRGGLGTPRS